MKTSLYQLTKLEVLSLVNLTKDAIHIHVGMITFLAWLVIFRKPINSLKSLIPVLIVVLMMEAFDLRDDYNAFGYFRWMASLHDFLNSMLWPILLVVFSKWYLIKLED